MVRSVFWKQVSPATVGTVGRRGEKGGVGIGEGAPAPRGVCGGRGHPAAGEDIHQGLGGAGGEGISRVTPRSQAGITGWGGAPR